MCMGFFFVGNYFSTLFDHRHALHCNYGFSVWRLINATGQSVAIHNTGGYVRNFTMEKNIINTHVNIANCENNSKTLVRELHRRLRRNQNNFECYGVLRTIHILRQQIMRQRGQHGIFEFQGDFVRYNILCELKTTEIGRLCHSFAEKQLPIEKKQKI